MASTFGFQESPIIESWIPLFLFTILFGLSMDYHVFLLSRVREHYDQTRDNTESVAFGIRSTGRLITGAALIMVAVFWGFAAGDLGGPTADGLRPGNRHPNRRYGREDDSGPLRHEAAGRLELVPAPVAIVVARLAG